MTKVARQGGLVTAVAAVLVMSAHASSPDPAYRLAGTLDAEERGWIAFLENREGEQEIVRAGDSLPGAEVLEIGADRVVLQTNSGRLVLTMAGEEHVASRVDSPTAMITADAEIRKNLETLLSAGLEDEEQEMKLWELLQLPPSAEILAVDDHQSDSASQAAKLLVNSLDSGSPVRVAVGGIEGFDAVYLMPDFEGDNKQ